MKNKVMSKMEICYSLRRSTCLPLVLSSNTLALQAYSRYINVCKC